MAASTGLSRLGLIAVSSPNLARRPTDPECKAECNG